MVRQSYTAVVERAQGASGRFDTEPYEVGWSTEAVVFIKVARLTEGAWVSATVQMSPDGIDWVEEGTAFEPIEGNGLYFVRLSHYGAWLRLSGEIVGPGATADLMVYIALKE